MVRDFDGHCNSFVFSSSRGVHRAHFKFKNKTPSHNGFECFILLFELRMAPRNGPTRRLTDHHHRSSILVHCCDWGLPAERLHMKLTESLQWSQGTTIL